MTAISPAREGIKLPGRQVIVDGVLSTITSVTDHTVEVDLPNGRCSRPEDSLIVLPVLGDFVATTDAHGQRREGYWIETNSAGLPGGRVGGSITATALVGDQITSITLEATGITLDARQVVQGSADVDQLPMLRAIATAEASHVATVRDHEAWKASLIEDMHEEANNHDLCSQFDDFCRRHDLPAREHDYALEVEVTVTVRTTRTGTSADDVIEDLDRDDVLDLIRHVDSGDIEDWTASEAC